MFTNDISTNVIIHRILQVAKVWIDRDKILNIEFSTIKKYKINKQEKDEENNTRIVKTRLNRQ